MLIPFQPSKPTTFTITAWFPAVSWWSSTKTMVYLPLTRGFSSKLHISMYKLIIQHCWQPLQLSVSSSPSRQLFGESQTAAVASSNVLLDLCNVVHCTQILCKLEHEVEGDTTFSYKEHNLQMHGFCNVSHGEKDPSPCDNLGIGNVRNDIVMHAPEDQASS